MIQNSIYWLVRLMKQEFHLECRMISVHPFYKHFIIQQTKEIWGSVCLSKYHENFRLSISIYDLYAVGIRFFSSFTRAVPCLTSIYASKVSQIATILRWRTVCLIFGFSIQFPFLYRPEAQFSFRISLIWLWKWNLKRENRYTRNSMVMVKHIKGGFTWSLFPFLGEKK